MRTLRKIAVASAAAAALCLAQAVTASACDAARPRSVLHCVRLARPLPSTTASPLPKRPAIRSWPILPESPASPNPRMGAIGVHYVKGDLVKDPAIDAKEPEALVYAPDGHGGLHLAALEYVVIQGDWNAHHIPPATLSVETHESIAPPMLFGHEFNFTDAPNRYGLPPFYSLHVWLWKNNPAGTLEMWNPNVNCDSPAPSGQR